MSLRATRTFETKRNSSPARSRAGHLEHAESFESSMPLLDLQGIVGNRNVARMIQTKLRTNEPGDCLEAEADRVADRMMQTPKGWARSELGITPQPMSYVRRACHDCESELRRKPSGEHKAPREQPQHPTVAPNLPREISSAKGSDTSLPQSARAFFEPRFGYNFDQVRIHAGPQAASIAQAVNARAFTVGHDVFFGANEYSPELHSGQRLIAHELAHVVQQTANGRPSTPGAVVGRTVDAGSILQRTPDDKKKDTDKDKSEPQAKDYKSITMHFNGLELIVSGDKKEIFRFYARSGRPIRVTPDDAKACGAGPVTDTYLSDKRFVGIKDHGPIPEGTYGFSAGGIERFTSDEQWQLLTGGILGQKSVTIHGHGIHPGDWGSGRVELHPKGGVKEGPCGSAKTRSEFFLHGGILAGSSGCIDIGSNFDKLADF